MCELVGNADLLSDHFDGKQSREYVDLLLTCQSSPSLIIVALRSSEVRRLLLDFYPYIVALTHWVCFIFFLGELLLFWRPVLV